ncbi:efflux RND transporter permease subunit [Escherichia coli]
MTQITGALVGIALVLSAVFVPMAFFGGSTGAIYRQFSLTIVSAMVLSVLVALILTPALCATLLKPMKQGEFGAQRPGFFGWFNRFFDTNANRYPERRAQGDRAGHPPTAPSIWPCWRCWRCSSCACPPPSCRKRIRGHHVHGAAPGRGYQGRTEVVLGEMRDYFLEEREGERGLRADGGGLQLRR